MEFLSRDVEKLLQDSIERADDFPNVLAEKFEGLSFADDSRLRSQIKMLCDNGYFSKLLWGDGVPCYGRVEQKGYDYFSRKDAYIRAKLRQDPYFSVLDEETEAMLSSFCKRDEANFFITGDSNLSRIIDHLNRYGYLNLGPQGISYSFGGNFTAVATVTQKGKNYFHDKEKRMEEIVILGDEALTVNNIDKQYNVSGNTITNSPFQVGDGNLQDIDYAEFEKKIEDLKSDISNLKLTEEQFAQLDGLIKSAEKGCKTQNATVFKKILSEIWDFAKQTGSNMLAAYLTLMFGFSK